MTAPNATLREKRGDRVGPALTFGYIAGKHLARAN
jgi:hypothetical protein